MRKGKDLDPDPYLWLMDPDTYPGGPKTCGSGIRIPNTAFYMNQMYEKCRNHHWTKTCDALKLQPTDGVKKLWTRKFYWWHGLASNKCRYRYWLVLTRIHTLPNRIFCFGSGFNQVSRYGFRIRSGSRREKVPHKNRKNEWIRIRNNDFKKVLVSVFNNALEYCGCGSRYLWTPSFARSGPASYFRAQISAGSGSSRQAHDRVRPATIILNFEVDRRDTINVDILSCFFNILYLE